MGGNLAGGLSGERMGGLNAVSIICGVGTSLVKTRISGVKRDSWCFLWLSNPHWK